MNNTEPARSGEVAQSSAATRVIATLAVIAALWSGQRFLMPLAAGLMLAMLVRPLAVRLEDWLRSPLAATVLTLTAVVGALAVGAIVFGAQLVRVAERVPGMISMAAQQMAERDPGTESILTRSRAALQQLDRATERLIAGKPLVPVGPSAALATKPNKNITDGAAVALRVTAVSGSSVLLGFAGNLSIIFFIAFF